MQRTRSSRASLFPLVFSAAMVLCARAALADAANPVESEIVAIVVTPELAIAVERQEVAGGSIACEGRAVVSQWGTTDRYSCLVEMIGSGESAFIDVCPSQMSLHVYASDGRQALVTVENGMQWRGEGTAELVGFAPYDIFVSLLAGQDENGFVPSAVLVDDPVEPGQGDAPTVPPAVTDYLSCVGRILHCEALSVACFGSVLLIPTTCLAACFAPDPTFLTKAACFSCIASSLTTFPASVSAGCAPAGACWTAAWEAGCGW